MILKSTALVTAVLLSAAACSDGRSARQSDVASPTDRLVATTTIWADITSQVACGEPVVAIIPAGADPHSFEPSLRDRQLLDEAAVVIANGNGLESSLVDLLTTIADEGVTVVEMTDHVEHFNGDPHIWQDPSIVADALPVLADALIAAGRDESTIRACASDYRAQLVALDHELTQRFTDIPVSNRVLVTSHDSLEYFARRYELDIVGAVIASTNTMAETNPADLAKLADLIAAKGVTTIFTEQLESTADAEALAARLDVAVVALITDALSDEPPGDTYIGMLRSNAEAIASAIGGP
jgi:zinc/manganese transport system substrate-binding protein